MAKLKIMTYTYLTVNSQGTKIMVSLGQYIAIRLQQLGIQKYFAIPGDFNLTLLDELLKETNLQMINCCNELNAGYAADGYARIHGISALVVTYSVGGLSAINAVTGAYSENLPIIVISGCPNSASLKNAEVIHHTLGDTNNSYTLEIFEKVTAHCTRIFDLNSAPAQIDQAIAIAIEKRKPVYIEVCCNLADALISSPTPRAFNSKKISDTSSLKKALELATETINEALKPVMVVGCNARRGNANKSIEELSLKTGIPIAVMPDAKGFISETHPNYIGVYWGPISSPGTSEIIESSDCYFFIGANFTDYNTCGYRCNIHPQKMITINNGTLTVSENAFTEVYMNDFFGALKDLLKFNNTALINYKRIYHPNMPILEPKDKKSPITRTHFFQLAQEMINKNPNDYAIIAETGDSWFNAMELFLAAEMPFAIQMQYGSIGWSVGALLGMQAALQSQRRVLAFIGDGSFQMSAQELSTLIRYNFKPIIFLMNNGSYTIEVQIHDGPYNVINNWKYHQLVTVFNGEAHQAKTFCVKTFGELKQAIHEASQTDALCFIEVMIDKDDCNKNLLQWGSLVSSFNSRTDK